MEPYIPIDKSRRLTALWVKRVVEDSGFEPLAFSMPLRRATNCANPPRGLWDVLYTLALQKSRPFGQFFAISPSHRRR